MTNTWTIQSILQWCTTKFKELKYSTPLLDAQLLMCHALSLTKVQLYTDFLRPLNENERENIRNLVKRRLKGEPVAYILQKKYWHDLELYVDSRVLIPRNETETLLDILIQSQKAPSSSFIIWDLCTGSGCLAIALARIFPQAQIIAVDISQEALEVAKLNIEKYKLNNIELIQGDVTLEKTYQDLLSRGIPSWLVSNPPYVSEKEWHSCMKDVKDFEPKIALVSPEEGLYIPESILKNASSLFHQGLCFFAMELGPSGPADLLKRQKRDIPEAHSSQYIPSDEEKNFHIIKDLAQTPRFLIHIS